MTKKAFTISFTAEWSPKAQKNLASLAKDIQLKITEKIKFIEEDPFKYVEHFEKEGLYKLRFGKYRTLLSINFKEKILFIEIFDKRGRVYKR
ncbi:type II toxin-antitoxin system RelE/ParE family toxin [Candidatus Woesearchaeota archaeon]|nr:type II toxin-antitoxin system RelE/ParE family toxin [Candidatus Woesearchaeota archaeon]